MFELFRETPRRTLLIFSLVALIAITYIVLVITLTLSENSGELGATLDDTWIHVRYAAKIADGQGLQYNAGEFSTGATSPLWALLLASVYAVINPPIFTQVHIAVLMSALFYLLTVLATTGLGWWVTRRVWIGLAAGILTALVGRLVWMGLSGMETMAFTCFSLMALWSHLSDLRDQRPVGWRTGILLALTTLARPEGYLLTLLVGLEQLTLTRRESDSPSTQREGWVVRVFLRHWKGALAYLILASSYPIVCLLISGSPFPSTFHAKSQAGHELPLLSEFFVTPREDYGAILFALVLFGTGVMLWKRNFSLALWPHLFVLAVMMQGQGLFAVNLSRYVAPAIPFHMLAAVVGVDAIGQWIRKMTPSTLSTSSEGTLKTSFMAGVIFAFLLALPIFILGTDFSLRVPNDVHQLRRMHVQAGFWFREYLQPGETMALNDVGAITHISNRRVIDMEGLVSPRITNGEEDIPYEPCPHDLQLARLLLNDPQPPRLFGIFHTWYPCLSLWEGALQPFWGFSIEGETVIGGHELLIAWPVWENWPMLKAVPSDGIPVGAHFTDGVELAAYKTERTEQGLMVTLWWHAHAQPRQNYHVFVHLVDANGTILGQHDGEPQENRFKMTWWRDGDIIQDRHLIAEPASLENVFLRIGVYDFANGQRLARSDGDQADTVVIPLND